jgi:hypothetical protein
MEKDSKRMSESNFGSQKIQLVVPSDSSCPIKVGLILIGTSAKLPTLSSLRLLSEVVETFLNENRNMTPEEYESRFPAYFDCDDQSPVSPGPKGGVQTIELLLDVENLQSKNIELLLFGAECIMADFEDFELLNVFLIRSKKYVQQQLKLSRKEYQKKIDCLVRQTSREISECFSSPSKMGQSRLHIMSMSGVPTIDRRPSDESYPQMAKNYGQSIKDSMQQSTEQSTQQSLASMGSIYTAQTCGSIYDYQQPPQSTNNAYNLPQDNTFNRNTYSQGASQQKVGQAKPFDPQSQMWNFGGFASISEQENPKKQNFNRVPDITIVNDRHNPYAEDSPQLESNPLNLDMNKTVLAEFVESFVEMDDRRDTKPPMCPGDYEVSVMIAEPKNYQAGGGGGILGPQNQQGGGGINPRGQHINRLNMDYYSTKPVLGNDGASKSPDYNLTPPGGKPTSNTNYTDFNTNQTGNQFQTNATESLTLSEIENRMQSEIFATSELAEAIPRTEWNKQVMGKVIQESVMFDPLGEHKETFNPNLANQMMFAESECMGVPLSNADVQ